MISKLAEAGMNVARLNMSHGDHASHLDVIKLVRAYNEQPNSNVIAIMLDTKVRTDTCPQTECVGGEHDMCDPRETEVAPPTLSTTTPLIPSHRNHPTPPYNKSRSLYPITPPSQGPEVRSGDMANPVMLNKGDPFTFTISRGVSTPTSVSVNYDGFIGDVAVGDTVLVDGGMMAFLVTEKAGNEVKTEVVDGGELKSRRHLNVRGKSATLPSITGEGSRVLGF